MNETIKTQWVVDLGGGVATQNVSLAVGPHAVVFHRL
jgi:hypothetical protein